MEQNVKWFYRQRAESVIESLKANEGTVVLRFHPESPVDRDRLIGLAKAEPIRFGLRPGGVFAMKLGEQDWDKTAAQLEAFLRELESGTTARLARGVDGGAREEGYEA